MQVKRGRLGDGDEKVQREDHSPWNAKMYNITILFIDHSVGKENFFSLTILYLFLATPPQKKDPKISRG